MGVPQLFQTLINNYNIKLLNELQSDLYTNFYLDFNCAIYQCIKPEIKTEDTLILHVIEYLDKLCKYIPNIRLLYVALDGVAPLAKIVNQRNRRFHSASKKLQIDEINQKYNII